MRKSLVVLSVVLLMYSVWPSHPGGRSLRQLRCISHLRRSLLFRKSTLNASAPTCDSCRTISLEGRGTGQRGGDIAAEYIATQFALNGLEACR
jgi:hypothetical protein